MLESTGDELRALLSPVSPERFVHEYWGQKALFVKGFPEKYRGLFSRDAFVEALALPVPHAPDFLRASFDKKGGAAEDARPRSRDELASAAFNATPEQALPLFRAGATLCATQVEARVPVLAPFAAAIKRQLGYPGRVTFNAYLSPPGAGFNWHWDSRIASTLQIEGTKKWRFSNTTAIAWPRANGALRGDGSGYYVDGKPSAPWEQVTRLDEKDTTEVLLEPGDLLILPAGAWHDAAGGEGGSLALNLSFTAVSYTVLVRELLDQLLSADPGWRGPSPLLPLAGAPAGEVDPRGLEEIARQLRRAADALGSVAADHPALVGIWSSFVQATGFGTASVRAREAGAVEAGDRLCVRRDGNVYARMADGGARLRVFIGTSGQVDATGPEIALIQRILSARTFTAGDCAGWGDTADPLAWDAVAETLTALVREGLLERA